MGERYTEIIEDIEIIGVDDDGMTVYKTTEHLVNLSTLDVVTDKVNNGDAVTEDELKIASIFKYIKGMNDGQN